MHLALEMSNQGRFAEADLLFKRAESMAKHALDKSDEARFLSYKALHRANSANEPLYEADEVVPDLARRAERQRKQAKQRFEEACQLAREATKLRDERVKTGLKLKPGQVQRKDIDVEARVEPPTVWIEYKAYILSRRRGSV